MSEAIRRSALALQAVQPQDREWVMQHLEPVQREALLASLSELETLGIQASADDWALLTEQLSAQPINTSALTDLEVLEAATAEQMLLILAEEPVTLIATVLAIQPWHWAASFVKGLPVVKQVKLRDRSVLEAPATALAEGLVHALANALRQSVVTVPAKSAHAIVSDDLVKRSWFRRIW